MVEVNAHEFRLRNASVALEATLAVLRSADLVSEKILESFTIEAAEWAAALAESDDRDYDFAGAWGAVDGQRQCLT